LDLKKGTPAGVVLILFFCYWMERYSLDCGFFYIEIKSCLSILILYLLHLSGTELHTIVYNLTYDQLGRMKEKQSNYGIIQYASRSTNASPVHPPCKPRQCETKSHKMGLITFENSHEFFFKLYRVVY
jgi:hypothetical protein